MTNDEAKFLLRASRPGSRDAKDPAFAQALAQAQKDPQLNAWYEKEQKLDAALSAKLNAIQPPPGLRDAILSGAKASQPRRNWWTHPVWLAAAASVVLLLSLTVRFRPPKNSAPTTQALVAFSIDDLANHEREHTGLPSGIPEFDANLASAASPLVGRSLDLDLNALKQNNCRKISLAGREVFEVCFERDGHWYHLYAARVESFAPGATDAKPSFIATGKLTASAWRDAKNLYVLTSDEGPEFLRRLM